MRARVRERERANETLRTDAGGAGNARLREF